MKAFFYLLTSLFLLVGINPVSANNLDKTTLPAADAPLKAQAAAIEKTNPANSPERNLTVVGDVIELDNPIETAHPYTPGATWQTTLQYENASYISVHFAEFNLAPGDVVTLSSPDEAYIHSYSGQGKKINDQEALSAFWAAHVPGDTMVITLHSNSPQSSYGFRIDKIAKGLPAAAINNIIEPVAESEFGEAICGVDDKEWAPCYDGTTMYENARAVARLLIQGRFLCTGWLVGSAGHLLTNNHCIQNANDAANTDYEFLAEGATCQTSCPQLSCPGIIEADGGTLIRTDVALDYSLVLLPVNVTPTYGYLQLRDTLPQVGERIYIPQHPGGEGKQLAVNDSLNGGFCGVFSNNQAGCTGPGPDTGYYCDTEGGSSGSPVLAYDDHLVVALHHCANCPNRGVPIVDVINSLGDDLPNDAIGSAAPPCTLAQTVSYLNGVLTLDYGVGSGAPVTWSTHLLVRGDAVPLWTVSAQVFDPPRSPTIQMPNFPSNIGRVGFHTRLIDANGDNTCTDQDFIYTGAPAGTTIPSAEELEILFQ